MRWKPLEEAFVDHTSYHDAKNRCFVEAQMEVDHCTFEEAVAKLEAYDQSCAYWRNDLYQVQTRRFFCAEIGQEMMHINIRRIDGAPVFDWRHRQWIKNQLVGEECEAVELYPAESRLNDTSNKYHLWAFTDPAVRLPFGMQERDVIEDERRSPAGMRQRRILK